MDDKEVGKYWDENAENWIKLSRIKDDDGKKIGFIVKNYFKRSEGEIEEWIFGAAPKDITEKMRKFRIPSFTRILSEWLNMLIAEGFILEEFCEPYPDDEVLKKYPEEIDSTIIPFFFDYTL